MDLNKNNWFSLLKWKVLWNKLLRRKALENLPIIIESEAELNEQQNDNVRKNELLNTGSSTKIIVATSIQPNRIELQKMAINTWLKVGFKVVSLNTKEEVDMLEQYFPNVQFQIVERSAKDRYGKPYIYIYDFMRYLDSTDVEICGIINSDIHFRDVKNDFIDFIREEASNSLVYGHRLDVNNIDDSYGNLSNGVDYFFFDKNLISIYKDDGLCMGQPAWDWWMVCVLCIRI